MSSPPEPPTPVPPTPEPRTPEPRTPEPRTPEPRTYAGQVALVEREAARIVTLLADADADLDAPVPWCGAWDVRALVGHLGTVHRWARVSLATPPDARAPRESGPPVGLDRTGLAAWFAEGAAELVGALADAGPDLPCWTFAPPATAAFWARRQVHETAVHRWDLERALGVDDPHLDDAVALDGIDEVVSVILPRQLRLGRLPAGEEWVELRPVGAAPVAVGPHDEATGRAAEPAAVVTGPAYRLVLALWGRDDLATLPVLGDRDALAAMLARPLTP